VASPMPPSPRNPGGTLILLIAFESVMSDFERASYDFWMSRKYVIRSLRTFLQAGHDGLSDQLTSSKASKTYPEICLLVSPLGSP